MPHPAQPKYPRPIGFAKTGLHEIAARRVADVRAAIKGAEYVVIRCGAGFSVGPLTGLPAKKLGEILYRAKPPGA